MTAFEISILVCLVSGFVAACAHGYVTGRRKARHQEERAFAYMDKLDEERRRNGS